MNIDGIQSELMRLYGGRSQGVRGGGAAGAPSEAGGADRPGGTGRTDGFVLSQEAAFVRRLAGVVATLPDVRESLVSALQSQVRAGTYQPADEAVARQLLGLGVADQ